MYSCHHCEHSCANRTGFNKHMRLHISTDIKFLKAMELQRDRVHQESEKMDVAMPAQNIIKKITDDIKSRKKFTKYNASDERDLDTEHSKDNSGLGFALENKKGAYGEEDEDEEVFADESEEEADLRDAQEVFPSPPAAQPTTAAAPPGTPAPTGRIPSSTSLLYAGRKATLQEIAKAPVRGPVMPDLENHNSYRSVNKEGNVKSEIDDEKEKKLAKETSDMEFDEKYKKELLDIEFEKKCRKEISEEEDEMVNKKSKAGEILVKANLGIAAFSEIGKLESDTSLDEDFDEDFEDEIYDDEFSDQYMELDQLTLQDGQKSENSSMVDINQILAKYSTIGVCAPKQEIKSDSQTSKKPCVQNLNNKEPVVAIKHEKNEQEDRMKKSNEGTKQGDTLAMKMKKELSWPMKQETSLLIKQEPEPTLFIKQEPSLLIKQEPNLPFKQEPNISIKQEQSLLIKQRSNLSTRHEQNGPVKQERRPSMEQEPSVAMNQEPGFPVPLYQGSNSSMNQEYNSKQGSSSSIVEKEKGNSKEYRCEKCSKVLSSKYTLKIHDRIHTGEKPHTCDQCKESFTRRSQLVGHVTRAHGAL